MTKESLEEAQKRLSDIQESQPDIKSLTDQAV